MIDCAAALEKWNGGCAQDPSVYQIADCMLRCAATMCLLGLCLCAAGRREGRHIPYFAVVYRTPRDFTAVDLLRNKIVTDITLLYINPDTLPPYPRKYT